MVDTLVSTLLTPVNLLFVVGMLVIFASSLRPGTRGSRVRQLHLAAPAMLTGMGILGTFVGILIGLLAFDVNQVQASIPALLEGMKTAFLTSVVGLVLSLVHRAVSLRRPGDPAQAGGLTIADMVHDLRALTQVTRSQTEAVQSQGKSLEKIATAIGGSEDSSLLSQLKLHRQDTRDGFGELAKEFKAFATQVSELGSKALIQALEEVIRDFNQKLSEQFGENFKELNSAVAALVGWQESYRTHVEALEARLANAIGAIESARQSLEQITQHVERLPKPLEQVGTLLSTLETEHQRLASQLEAYAALREQAIEAFPVIEANLRTVTTAMSDAVESTRRGLETAHARQAEAYGEIERGYSAIVRQTGDLTKRQQEVVEAQLREAQLRLESMAQEYQRGASTVLNEMRTGFEASVKDHANVMEQQVRNLDQALEAELRKAIQLLGQHLAGLHEKVAADYEPLTRNLARLVNLGRTGN